LAKYDNQCDHEMAEVDNWRHGEREKELGNELGRLITASVYMDNRCGEMRGLLSLFSAEKKKSGGGGRDQVGRVEKAFGPDPWQAGCSNETSY
jgi:hypothetical protein